MCTSENGDSLYCAHRAGGVSQGRGKERAPQYGCAALAFGLASFHTEGGTLKLTKAQLLDTQKKKNPLRLDA